MLGRIRSPRAGQKAPTSMMRTGKSPSFTKTLRIRCMRTSFRPFASCCSISRCEARIARARCVPSMRQAVTRQGAVGCDSGKIKEWCRVEDVACLRKPADEPRGPSAHSRGRCPL